MTQNNLTEKECGILGLALAKLSIMSKMGIIKSPWVNATDIEMAEILRKLEQLQLEAMQSNMQVTDCGQCSTHPHMDNQNCNECRINPKVMQFQEP